MNQTFIIVSLAFTISLALSIYILPRMMVVSVKNQWDRKGDDLSRDGVRVYQIAGLSILPIILLSLCSSLLIPIALPWKELSQSCTSMVPRIFTLITGSLILFIVGLKYDINGASSGVRTVALLLASCVFAVSNMPVNNLHGLFGIYEIPAWVGAVLTVIVSFLIIFTFRLLDGFDSLVSSIGIMVLVLFIPILLRSSRITPLLITAVLLGVIVPYWMIKTFWKKWAHCSMGNSGSYILGFFIAYLLIVICRGSEYEYGKGAMTVAMSVLMFPVLEIIRVLGSRLRDGREVFTQDRNQINDKLYRTGIRRTGICLALMLIPVAFFVFSCLMVESNVNYTIIFGLDIMLWVLMHWVINWRIRVYEEKTHRSVWNKEYGEEAWNAHVPHEVLEKKIRVFGTMGLPSNMVEKDTMAFIPDGMTALERGVKRGIDMLISIVCIIVFSPLFLLSYILIKLDDGGPAIYKQERIGRFGRPFCIYKYRSMRLDAEKMGPQLSHAGGDEDPRLTKIGKFLRRHHLDELPQLWNVLIGDMAFVGYRPERKHFIDQIMQHDPRYSFLYQIRPGVTSYATLYNGYTDTMEKMLRRLELDLYYLRHRSFWFDIKVLILTFGSIIFGKKF